MEKQILGIAHGLIESNFKVTVVALDSTGSDAYFVYDNRIEFLNLNIGSANIKASCREKINRQIRVFHILRKKEISGAIAFTTGSYWYSLFPTILARVPIYLAERNGPSVYQITRVRKYRKLIFLTMLFSKKIIIQFPSFANKYPVYLRRKLFVIPNRVPDPYLIFQPPKKQVRFIFAGRFTYQKQILELINAFAEFSKVYKHTKLDIYGEGELFSQMANLIKHKELQKVVTLNKSNPNFDKFLRGHHVMIAPSLWEGFPNSVAEALACGIPVAGFSDCEGVRDLIIPGVNGWLIERKSSENSIINLLTIVYKERKNIGTYSKGASKSVLNYQSDEIYKMWANLF